MFIREKLKSNMVSLIKNSNVKVAELEAALGVSTGYISRLTRKDSTTVPSVEFLCAFSEYFSISLDSLLYSDMNCLSPTENKIVKFLAKISVDTFIHGMPWVREAEYFLTHDCEDPDNQPHPLFVQCDAYSMEYCSKFHDDNQGYIVGDAYRVPLGDSTTFYITKITPERDKSSCPDYEYEVYLVRNDNSVIPICSSHNSREKNCFYNHLEGLYKGIKTYCEHTNLSKEADTIIDAFLSDNMDSIKPIENFEEIIDDDDDLPF